MNLWVCSTFSRNTLKVYTERVLQKILFVDVIYEVIYASIYIYI